MNMRFWLLALVWLPAGVVAVTLVRFGTTAGFAMHPADLPMAAASPRQICSDSPEEIVTAVLGIYHGLFWPLWTELGAMVVTPGRLMFPEVDFRSVEA